MRLTIPQPLLAAAAHRAARQLPTQTLYPVLMGLRLTADAGALHVSAFDGFTATHSRLEADVDAGGDVLVSGRLLADVVKTLGKTDVTLSAEDGHLTLTTADARVELATIDSRDYPALPQPPAPSGTVDGAELAAAYKAVKDAVDPKADGAFAGMAGVRLRTTDGRLQLSTTDRYRIADAWLSWTGQAPADGAMCIVPEKVFAQNIAALADGDIQVALPADGAGTAAFSAEGFEVTSMVLDPQVFPHKVDKAIPAQFTATAVFDAAEAADALRRVAVVTEPGKPTWLTFDPGGTATLQARDRGSATARFPAEYDGDQEQFEAAWNAEYLRDGLATFDGTVHMQVTTPGTPAVLTDPEDDSHRYTVIPIRDPKPQKGDG
jgi:DNA polymerase-3 subunit beta